MSKAVPIGEVFEQELPCALTSEEHESLNQQIADIQHKLLALEAEKKKAVKPLADKQKELVKQNRKLVIQRDEGGFAPKPTPCRWEDDGAFVYLVRLDGPVPVEVPKTRRPMTDADRTEGVALPEVDLSDVLGAADENSPEAIAKRLSAVGKRVVLVLANAMGPMSVERIAVAADCRAGRVVKTLSGEGVAEHYEGHDDQPGEPDVAPGWILTPTGKQVAAVLQASEGAA